MRLPFSTTKARPAAHAVDAPASADDHELVGQARERETQRLGGRDRTTTLALAGAFVAVAAALLVWMPQSAPPDALLACALVLAFAFAARVQFEVGFGSAVPTQLVFVPMLFLAPAAWVPALVAAGFILSKAPEQMRGTWHPERIALHLVSAWFSVGPVVVLWLAGNPAPTVEHIPLVLGALAAQFAFDFTGSAVRGSVGLDLPLRTLPGILAPAWVVDMALTPIGLALADVARTHGYAFLLGVPLMGLLAYFARERRVRIDHALELSHAYRGTALLLGDMVEADDSYTGLHSQDVVGLAVAVSDALGLSQRDRLHAELTALLHDVGKVRIPNEILTKPGPLTLEERAVIETHTVEGERMLVGVGGLLGQVGRLVRSCHERWDGGGYPDGLAGDGIPLVARIVCACDAFSAMTTTRPYRDALADEQAIAELGRCSGTHFDPRVVAALTDVVSRSGRPRLLELGRAA
jgi:HD-GYP domain-containing protein (c-di-GMP phosphodiesterase class II)